MPYFNRSWSFDRIIEEFQYLLYSLEASESTTPLAAPVASMLRELTSFREKQKEDRLEQLRLSAKLYAADRVLDLALSKLSAAARQLERQNPALRLVGVLFPEGVKDVTKPSGRGVGQEIAGTRHLLEVLQELPGTESLAADAEAVHGACAKTEACLRDLMAIDEQVERNRMLENELTERAYAAYHRTKADLIKLFNNSRAHIDSFFLT